MAICILLPGDGRAIFHLDEREPDLSFAPVAATKSIIQAVGHYPRPVHVPNPRSLNAGMDPQAAPSGTLQGEALRA